jgi:hypothetical protein
MKTIPILCILSFLLFDISFQPGSTWAAENLLTNGTFADSLTGWNVNPKLGTWNPLTAGGTVSLHPSSPMGFNGTIIYQNLNVSGISGKTLSLSMKLTKISAPDSDQSTIAGYLTYLNADNLPLRAKVSLLPGNTGIETGTEVTGSLIIPDGAQKLVKLEIAKEDYGEFEADDIALEGDGLVAGGVPIITGLSAAGGTYGTSFAITGTGFGASQGYVFVGGTSGGITVDSWTDTAVSLTVWEPARSGSVKIVADYVESNVDKTFEVTSPNFTLDLSTPKLKVVQGQKAEIVLKVGFHHGFTTSNGIGFFSPEFPSETTFTPVPVKSPGGVLLIIDTSGMSPGVHSGSVQSLEDTSYARFAPFTLEVVTIADVRFFDNNTEKTLITAKTITNQGQFGANNFQYGQPYVSYEVIDNNGDTLNNDVITLRSEYPFIIGAYQRYWGYDLYALANGIARLIPVAPDGTELMAKALPVTVAIPPTATQFSSVSLTPSPVSNKGTEDITFFAAANGAVTWFGYDSSGLMNFATSAMDDINYANNCGYSPGPECGTVQTVFRMTSPPSDLGTAVMYTSSGTATVALPLTTYNDPSYSGLRCIIKTFDDSIPMWAMDGFNLEFYLPGETTPAFTRMIWSMGAGSGKTVVIGGIPPGTYKIKYVAGGGDVESQFYPNTTDIDAALLVDLPAGQFGEVHFFPQLMTVTVLQGDINGDSVVDLIDAILALQVTAGMSPVNIRSNYSASGADCNGDNKIGLEEVIFILKAIAES